MIGSSDGICTGTFLEGLEGDICLVRQAWEHFPGVGYFDVSEEFGRIILAPVRVNPADAVRAKLAELGIEDSDVRDAVRWARENR